MDIDGESRKQLLARQNSSIGMGGAAVAEINLDRMVIEDDAHALDSSVSDDDDSVNSSSGEDGGTSSRLELEQLEQLHGPTNTVTAQLESKHNSARKSWAGATESTRKAIKATNTFRHRSNIPSAATCPLPLDDAAEHALLRLKHDPNIDLYREIFHRIDHNGVSLLPSPSSLLDAA